MGVLGPPGVHTFLSQQSQAQAASHWRSWYNAGTREGQGQAEQGVCACSEGLSALVTCCRHEAGCSAGMQPAIQLQGPSCRACPLNAPAVQPAWSRSDAAAGLRAGAGQLRRAVRQLQGPT